MKLGKKFLILLIISALMLGTYVGTTLAEGDPHECDCSGECDATDNCCGCGDFSACCKECDADQKCETGLLTWIEGESYYPVWCEDC